MCHAIDEMNQGNSNSMLNCFVQYWCLNYSYTTVFCFLDRKFWNYSCIYVFKNDILISGWNIMRQNEMFLNRIKHHKFERKKWEIEWNTLEMTVLWNQMENCKIKCLWDFFIFLYLSYAAVVRLGKLYLNRFNIST